MALAKYGNKRDANEPEIVAMLEAHGFTVHRLDKPVDLLCGYGGRDYLIEVKTPKGTLTKSQKDFYATWRGSKTILRSAEDAEAFARGVRKNSAP